jgi:hypothetical protein
MRIEIKIELENYVQYLRPSTIATT